MFEEEDDDPEFRAFKPQKSPFQQLNPFKTQTASTAALKSSPTRHKGCDLIQILTPKLNRKDVPKLERDDYQT